MNRIIVGIRGKEGNGYLTYYKVQNGFQHDTHIFYERSLTDGVLSFICTQENFNHTILSRCYSTNSFSKGQLRHVKGQALHIIGANESVTLTLIELMLFLKDNKE